MRCCSKCLRNPCLFYCNSKFIQFKMYTITDCIQFVCVVYEQNVDVKDARIWYFGCHLTYSKSPLHVLCCVRLSNVSHASQYIMRNNVLL